MPYVVALVVHSPERVADMVVCRSYILLVEHCTDPADSPVVDLEDTRWVVAVVVAGLHMEMNSHRETLVAMLRRYCSMELGGVGGEDGGMLLFDHLPRLAVVDIATEVVLLDLDLDKGRFLEMVVDIEIRDVLASLEDNAIQGVLADL